MTLQKVENLENDMAKLTIEVAADEVAKALDASYQKKKKNISVPGFRKGKVPKNLIEKMYGPEIFYDDAAEQLVNQSYPDAATESKLEIVAQPDIEIVQMEKGKDFIYTAEVVLKPTVELGEYKGIEVAKQDAKATAADVNAELEKVREQNARTVSVEDRAVKKGDDIVFDFEGFVDGVPFDGGKAENYPLNIGSGQFIPGFEDQLVGAEIGKEKEVNVTFPEDYHVDELKGKPAVFKCTVHEIKYKELPKVDDEFAADVSEFETLKEYKADIKKQIADRKSKAAKNAKENEALTKIIEASKMKIHDKMVDNQVRNMINEFAQNLQAQGLSIDHYLQYTGMTPQMLMENMKPQALQRIKSRLVLEAIAAKEAFKVTKNDIDKEIEKMASMYQMEVEKLQEMIGDAERESMKKDIAVQKAADFIVKNSVEAEPEKEEEAKDSKDAE